MIRRLASFFQGDEMGLAFLPWERLPPYILGPVLCVLNLWLFFFEDTHPFSKWGWEAAGFALGAGIIWRGYRKDKGRAELAKEDSDKVPLDKS